MPRYEFRCEECLAYQETQIHFEVGPECPVCYRTMKREWSAPNIQFKGSGFYKTDNQN
jgi:putative FmdB family regulatory protein